MQERKKMGRTVAARVLQVALIGAVALAMTTSVAGADDRKVKAEELYSLGAKLFEARQYAEAARLFDQSYRLDPVPSALFNKARCLEESKDTEAAVAAFRAYLDADPDGPGSAEAQTRLLSLERAL